MISCRARTCPGQQVLRQEERPNILEDTYPVTWIDDHQARLSIRIDLLTQPEVMAYPDFKTGLGPVLYQEQGEKLRVVGYGSRTLTPTERNNHLHSGKLELLAVKWAFTDKFWDYLFYEPSFVVYTDNNPLTYVMSSAKLNATSLRWVAELADYIFTIKYRAGDTNIDADYLSRITWTPKWEPVRKNYLRTFWEPQLIGGSERTVARQDPLKNSTYHRFDNFWTHPTGPKT